MMNRIFKRCLFGMRMKKKCGDKNNEQLIIYVSVDKLDSKDVEMRFIIWKKNEVLLSYFACRICMYSIQL